MRYQRKTPIWLIQDMCSIIPIVEPENGFMFLEPSAGEGIVVEYLKSKYSRSEVHCFELNDKKRQELKKAGHSVIGADFLQYNSYSFYDYIIMLPPFKHNEDVIHIEKAYKNLKKGGAIAALTSPKWLIENHRHQAHFRKFLEDKRHYIRVVKDNTFVEKRKTVPCTILNLFK